MNEFADVSNNSYIDWTMKEGINFFTQKPPSCIESTEGFTVTLHCSAGGNPKPKITWLKGKKQAVPVKDGSHYTVLPDGSLQITDIRKTSRGTYTCEASNEHRNKSAAVKLQVVTMDEVCGVVQEESEEGDLDIKRIEEERVRRVVGGESSHIQYWPWQVNHKQPTSRNQGGEGGGVGWGGGVGV